METPSVWWWTSFSHDCYFLRVFEGLRCGFIVLAFRGYEKLILRCTCISARHRTYALSNGVWLVKVRHGRLWLFVTWLQLVSPITPSTVTGTSI